MIIPSNRFIILAVLAIMPLALPGYVAVGIGAFVLIAAVAAFDGIRGRNMIGAFTVSMPQRVQLAKGRGDEIEVTLTNTTQYEKNVRFGIDLPSAFEPMPWEQWQKLPAEASVTLAFPCMANRRGLFTVHRCVIALISPLGLWTIRAVRPCSIELRVFPNIKPERKNLAALFLNRESQGFHGVRQLGKGREFEHLRNYMPSDSYEDIYWKATARRRYPVTKVFQVERTQEVYVIIDGSRLSGRQVAVSEKNQEQTTIMERYIIAAMIMGLAAERQGDLFGLTSYSDGIDAFIRAKNGPAHYNACREAIFSLEPKTVTPDYAELFTFLSLRLRRRALLLFLTSLDDHLLTENFCSNIHILARRHLVQVNMIRPISAKPLFTPDSIDDTVEEADLYGHLGGHMLYAELAETRKILRQKGVGFSFLDNHSLSADLVRQYSTIKQRQIL